MNHQDKILHEEEKTTEFIDELVASDAAEAVSDTADNSATDDYEQVVTKLQTALTQANDKAARSLADYQNLIRRHREEKTALAKYATAEFVVNLIEPIDNLTLAAASLNDQGLNMVVEQFTKVLTDNGVTRLDPLDRKFDANTMEAVEKVGEGQKVKKVLSTGYLVGDKVLRPARVVVG